MTLPLPGQTSPNVSALGWSPERKARFLDTLSRHGNPRAACRAVGMSAESAYKLRRREPLFARAWAAAVVLGRDASVATLGERAIEGVEEQIYYRGELIGTRRRYDSRLLLAHLARLDRLADEKSAGEDAGRFDELLACVAEGSEQLPHSREEAMEEAGLAAGHALHAEHIEAHPELFEEDRCDLSDDQIEHLETLDEKCKEAAHRAASEAGKAWSDRRTTIRATVDALCNDRDEEGPGRLSAGRAGEGPFSPCTPSTVSTTALAAALPLQVGSAPEEPLVLPSFANKGGGGGRPPAS